METGRLFVVAFFVVVAALCPCVRGNITNGGFAGDLSGWSVWTDPAGVPADAFVSVWDFGGDGEAAFTEQEGDPIHLRLYQSVGVLAEAKTLSFELTILSAQAAESDYFSVYMADASLNATGPALFGWTNHGTGVVVAGETIERSVGAFSEERWLVFDFQADGEESVGDWPMTRIFLDDVAFSAAVIPAPSAFVLGALGASLVGWGRRRVGRS